MVDAAAATTCHAAGIGATVSVMLVHHHDPRWGHPIPVQGRVRALSDGLFSYAGGIWDGVAADMGPSAILEIGTLQVLVATHATYDWADEQFRSMGLNTADARFLVVKNPINYRNIQSNRDRVNYVLDTPGPASATTGHPTPTIALHWCPAEGLALDSRAPTEGWWWLVLEQVARHAKEGGRCCNRRAIE